MQGWPDGANHPHQANSQLVQVIFDLQPGRIAQCCIIKPRGLMSCIQGPLKESQLSILDELYDGFTRQAPPALGQRAADAQCLLVFLKLPELGPYSNRYSHTDCP